MKHKIAISLGLLALIAAADAAGQVTSITTDAGDTYDVPTGSSVYIAEAPAFGLETQPSGDLHFERLTPIDWMGEEPVVFTEPEPVEEPCKLDGPIKRVNGEWRFCNGSGWVVDGPEMQWHGEAYGSDSAAFVASIGDYGAYSGDGMDPLKRLLTGNSWWHPRLSGYAADVVSTGTSSRFYNQFRGTSDSMKTYALAVLNRYVALLMDGYTASEINSYVFGGGE
jgi:hypothetical protein